MVRTRTRFAIAARAALLASASVLAIALAASQAYAACGQPITAGELPTTRDALHVLRASVGAVTCDLCECDVDNSGSVTTTDALIVLRAAVGLSQMMDCPGCGTADPQCPGVVQFALFSNVQPGVCTTNGDCIGFAYCDQEIHRCRTVTQNDVGWNGLAHNSDIDTPIPSRFFLDCEGPAPCGQCEITGHDPSLHNCRCANDNRTACDTVVGPDEDDCGGEMCNCYFGPPMPLSAGNTPVCVLNGLAANPTGTANVDEGSGTIHLPLLEKIFLGISIVAPCPLCVNDPTPADGVRGGVCVGGQNDTQNCDAHAYNATFPPPTGGLYSIDCFPLAGADISNGGLPLTFDVSTGQQTLTASVPCGDGELADIMCHCRVCSGDAKLACSSDEQCAAANAGTCSSNGGGEQTLPNACTNGVCELAGTVAGNNEGLCADGPDDTWCDAVVRPDGGGLIGCGSNIDCDASSIGFDAGTCSLVTRRPCFMDTIVSQGVPHPAAPIASGIFCSPASSATSVNTAAGLPGPGRVIWQNAFTLFCNSDPQAVYTPGVGGCPEPVEP